MTLEERIVRQLEDRGMYVVNPAEVLAALKTEGASPSILQLIAALGIDEIQVKALAPQQKMALQGEVTEARKEATS